MDSASEIDTQLLDAEEALKQAEETHGQDHIAVSYCLDNVARMLRSRGIRALDAANMDARVIRYPNEMQYESQKRCGP